ncbi:phage holin family protein [Geodermatophilus sp. DSM 44513]|uniref:phage holin family protein n=1 Tax=Geodermatophilus sp. DSM 44513 TaxID=1528104 RepID=UPI00127E294A|nr:phage holin family protein [Geodermatophilus sp. DSM 44513]WNV75560.1 phage holin family protein [Geodermatophilus sp. DSM 44513]
MFRFLAKVVLMAAVFWGVTQVVGGITVLPNPQGPLGEPGTWLWISLLFALVNAVVGPVLRLLSLPFVLVTLGLFLLVVNAALLGTTAVLSDRLQVDGVGAAVLGGLLLAVGGWIVDQLTERR